LRRQFESGIAIAIAGAHGEPRRAIMDGASFIGPFVRQPLPKRFLCAMRVVPPTNTSQVLNRIGSTKRPRFDVVKLDLPA
jgi:hypothetical protein